MKKFFATTLAVTMAAATLGTTAFAADATSPTTLTDESKSVSIPVTGQYIDQKESDEIISMDVKWGSMEFTYAATQQGTWNPDSHSYDNASTDAAWVGKTSSDITVTNHSNVDVTASFAFEKAEGYSDVTGTFSQDSSDVSSVDLEAGVENGYDDADNETVTFKIGGSMADTTKDASTQIGIITVSVEKKIAE